MIKRLLKHLRQKPKAARDSIAFGVAGAFTAIILMIWVYHLPARYTEIKSQQETSESSFTQLFSNIKEQFATVKDSVADVDATDDTLDLDVFMETLETDSPVTATVEAVGEEQLVVSADDVSSTDIMVVASTSVALATTTTPIIETEEISNTERPIRIVTFNKATATRATSTEIQ